jgi:hypothetical protein
VAVPENKMPPSAVMLRRGDTLAAGGFRTLARAADLDMWLRLLERGSALTIPHVTALYHVHAGQVSGDAALMHAAHEAVLEAHAGRPWCSEALIRRHQGVVAWDRARGAGGGAMSLGTAVRLAATLASPQRALGAAQLLAGRLKGRRLAARLAPGGTPSMAVLPGVSGDAPAEAIDLRERGAVAALAQLVRRPPARALVAGRAAALVVRALGIEPVAARRGDGG